MKVIDLLEGKRKSNYDLRNELFAAKDDISRALGKIMKKQPAVFVFGKGETFRDLELNVMYWLPARGNVEDDTFFRHMARIATIAEVAKVTKEMVLHHQVGDPRGVGVQPKITYVFKRTKR